MAHTTAEDGMLAEERQCREPLPTTTTNSHNTRRPAVIGYRHLRRWWRNRNQPRPIQDVGHCR